MTSMGIDVLDPLKKKILGIWRRFFPPWAPVSTLDPPDFCTRPTPLAPDGNKSSTPSQRGRADLTARNVAPKAQSNSLIIKISIEPGDSPIANLRAPAAATASGCPEFPCVRKKSLRAAQTGPPS